MSYAWNKLRLAVHCLAEGGSQRERLAEAITDYLVGLRPKDLPSTWRPEFTSVIDRFCFCLGPAPKQNASIRRMIGALDDNEVTEMIGSILRLYDAVTRYQPIQAAEEVRESIASPSSSCKGAMKDPNPSKKILD